MRRKKYDDCKICCQLTGRAEERSRGASGIPVPVLRGTGIRVQTIVISSREWNETPAEIAAQYDLSESLIREALRFYQAHQVEVDLLIQSDP